MLYQILHLVVDFAGTLLAGACLLRAWMQRQRISMRNPLGQFVMTLTDWLIVPLRRLLPGYGGIDWASLLAAFLVALLAVGVLAFVVAPGLPPLLSLVLTALLWLVKWTVYLAQALVLVMAVLSWVNPFSPLLPVVDALAGPLLRPIRRVLPNVGRIDLSPLVFLLLAQIALIVLHEAGRGL